jgi:hypothetical protein
LGRFAGSDGSGIHHLVSKLIALLETTNDGVSRRPSSCVLVVSDETKNLSKNADGRVIVSFDSLAKDSLTMVSVYVDSDAVRLYRAGKASVWHAGVLLAAPTARSR